MHATSKLILKLHRLSSDTPIFSIENKNKFKPLILSDLK